MTLFSRNEHVIVAFVNLLIQMEPETKIASKAICFKPPTPSEQENLQHFEGTTISRIRDGHKGRK